MIALDHDLVQVVPNTVNFQDVIPQGKTRNGGQLGKSFLGSRPDRGQSPVEWGEIPSVHPYVHPPPPGLLAGSQATLAGPQAPLTGHQTPLTGPQASLTGLQGPLTGLQAYLKGPRLIRQALRPF